MAGRALTERKRHDNWILLPFQAGKPKLSNSDDSGVSESMKDPHSEEDVWKD